MTTTSRRSHQTRLSTLPISFILLSVVTLPAMRTAFAAEEESVPIKVDQVGYLPGAPNLAVVTVAAMDAMESLQKHLRLPPHGFVENVISDTHDKLTAQTEHLARQAAPFEVYLASALH